MSSSELPLAATVEHLPVAVVLVDRETGRVLFENSASRTLGLATRLLEPLILRAARGEQLMELIHERRGDRELRLVVQVHPFVHRARALSAITFTDLAETTSSASQAAPAGDDLLTVATHELRSPLASLRLVLERLRRRAEDGEIAELVATTRRQVDRLALLLQNLLDLGKLRNDRFALDLEPTDLVPIVTETAEAMRCQARQAGADIALRCDTSVEGLFDRERIEQIVANLVSNAIKYGRGTPIEVCLRREGALAVLVVRDGGGSIAPGDAERIFRLFERASPDKCGRSLGLGLFIVREIALRHGGRVSVASSPERGTAFTVELPITRELSPPSSATDELREQKNGHDASA